MGEKTGRGQHSKIQKKRQTVEKNFFISQNTKEIGVLKFELKGSISNKN